MFSWRVETEDGKLIGKVNADTVLEAIYEAKKLTDRPPASGHKLYVSSDIDDAE